MKEAHYTYRDADVKLCCVYRVLVVVTRLLYAGRLMLIQTNELERCLMKR